tara:strand:- start:2750 stop:2917 length:168 start_codon:yes stop_codon:yes gene_type:complete
MRIGDLVSVKLPCIQPFIGIAIKVNELKGALVRSTDGRFEYWVNSWSSEVISESR